jgi:hypothetical protein
MKVVLQALLFTFLSFASAADVSTVDPAQEPKQELVSKIGQLVYEVMNRSQQAAGLAPQFSAPSDLKLDIAQRLGSRFRLSDGTVSIDASRRYGFPLSVTVFRSTTRSRETRPKLPISVAWERAAFAMQPFCGEGWLLRNPEELDGGVRESPDGYEFTLRWAARNVPGSHLGWALPDTLTVDKFSGVIESFSIMHEPPRAPSAAEFKLAKTVEVLRATAYRMALEWGWERADNVGATDDGLLWTGIRPFGKWINPKAEAHVSAEKPPYGFLYRVTVVRQSGGNVNWGQFLVDAATGEPFCVATVDLGPIAGAGPAELDFGDKNRKLTVPTCASISGFGRMTASRPRTDLPSRGRVLVRAENGALRVFLLFGTSHLQCERSGKWYEADVSLTAMIKARGADLPPLLTRD